MNTNVRSKATNEFEKDFFKLMNNSVFGKTMENIRNRVNIRLVNNQKSLKKCAAKPNFDHCRKFDENRFSVHMKKNEFVFNKPVYLGMSILDLSKTLMYEFHYNYIKKKYGSKANMLFTDTDSLCHEIETEDFYKIFQLTPKKNSTLQIFHQTILRTFQQESTRRFQECLRMWLVVK